ncbi:MAG: hypothetical protein EA421_13520 [Gemmatimonadales bacterium]|nr:MAG: hypothetical protein EA421_13520 [Gemmatimonadales bacterium]
MTRPFHRGASRVGLLLSVLILFLGASPPGPISSSSAPFPGDSLLRVTSSPRSLASGVREAVGAEMLRDIWWTAWVASGAVAEGR